MRKGKASDPFFYQMGDVLNPKWVPINRKARRIHRKKDPDRVMLPAQLDPHRALKTEAGYMRWNKYGEVVVFKKETKK